MSRLYPGFGSNKGASFEDSFNVYSITCLGRNELEVGDKVIMSQSTFRKVSRAKLSFPLTFHVTNSRMEKRLEAEKAATSKQVRVKGTSKRPGVGLSGKSLNVISRSVDESDKRSEDDDEVQQQKKKKRPQPVQQYCGVLEFSGPEEKVFMPHWMMQNLRIKDGQSVKMRSVPEANKLPQGTLCRLQPHTTAFIDLAASMDVCELFEHAFRNYSVLSQGEMIVVNVAGKNFKINVLETQPAHAISLYGNLDLEVDFVPPMDQHDVGKLHPSSHDANTAAGETAAVAQDDTGMTPPPGANVMSFDQVVQFMQQRDDQQPKADITGNQSPSPGNTKTATPEQPAVHLWGSGYLLSGVSTTSAEASEQATRAVAAPEVAATTDSATGTTSSFRQPLRRARRRPTKFASRTSGSSFAGEGTALEPSLQEQQGANKQTQPQVSLNNSIAVFTGQGRTLQGSAPGSTTPKASGLVAKDVAAIREMRLRFLKNLGNKKDSAGSDIDNEQPTIAVGSSLNAIRKAKRN